jgi:hypothetical protein
LDIIGEHKALVAYCDKYIEQACVAIHDTTNKNALLEESLKEEQSSKGSLEVTYASELTKAKETLWSCERCSQWISRLCFPFLGWRLYDTHLHLHIGIALAQ